jgi:hypothetical protein
LSNGKNIKPTTDWLNVALASSPSKTLTAIDLLINVKVQGFHQSLTAFVAWTLMGDDICRLAVTIEYLQRFKHKFGIYVLRSRAERVTRVSCQDVADFVKVFPPPPHSTSFFELTPHRVRV